MIIPNLNLNLKFGIQLSGCKDYSPSMIKAVQGCVIKVDIENTTMPKTGLLRESFLTVATVNLG